MDSELIHKIFELGSNNDFVLVFMQIAGAFFGVVIGGYLSYRLQKRHDKFLERESDKSDMRSLIVRIRMYPLAVKHYINEQKEDQQYYVVREKANLDLECDLLNSNYRFHNYWSDNELTKYLYDLAVLKSFLFSLKHNLFLYDFAEHPEEAIKNQREYTNEDISGIEEYANQVASQIEGLREKLEL